MSSKKWNDRMSSESQGAIITLKPGVVLDDKTVQIFENLHGTECVIKSSTGEVLKPKRINQKASSETICKECGGKCCKGSGCHLSPEDVIKKIGKITSDGLLEFIKESSISIDWWEGNPFEGIDGHEFEKKDIGRSYFLRIRNVDADIVDPSWGGRCSLLTDTGCSLKYGDRPKGGRDLVLIEDYQKQCTLLYSKDECARDWFEYDNILKKITQKLR